jgi:polar amino acid transport system substrate-binding protein
MRHRLPILILLGLAAAPATADTIRIRADEWLPYNGRSTLRPPGYMIEMASAIAEAAGHRIDYRHIPWDDALAGVESGSFDCVVGAAAEEVPGFPRPALAWGESQSVAYTLAASTLVIDDVEAIKSLRLAVLADYSYGEVLDAWIEGEGAGSDRLVAVETNVRASRAVLSYLIAGKVDVVIDDRNVILNTLRDEGLEGRVVERLEVGPADPVYIACTPADPRGARYAALFEQGTRQLRESGQLANILARYGLTDWAAAGGPEAGR